MLQWSEAGTLQSRLLAEKKDRVSNETTSPQINETEQEEALNGLVDKDTTYSMHDEVAFASASRNRWYRDSGATSHLANDKAMFTTYQETPNQGQKCVSG